VREDDLLEPDVPPEDDEARPLEGPDRGDGDGLEPEEHIGLTPPD
jgi:hypothetical protein